VRDSEQSKSQRERFFVLFFQCLSTKSPAQPRLSLSLFPSLSLFSLPSLSFPFPLSFPHSGRGAVTAVAASADAVVVVTSRAYLLRYDVASGGPPVEVELVPASARSSSSSSSPAATGVWLDPATGSHAVVAVDGLSGTSGTSGTSGALYVHARWRKPRPLSLAGGGGASGGAAAAPPSACASSPVARLSAAAFDGAAVTEGTTGPVLVATSAGVLSSFSFDERDKRERSSGKLYSLGKRLGPVGGVALARTSDGAKRLALVATAERLFVFSAQLSPPSRRPGDESSSSSSLEPLFSTCSPDPADLTNFLGAAAAFARPAPDLDAAAAPAAPGGVEGAGGVALVPPLPGAPFDRFVWLSRAGLVSGSLDSALERAAASAAAAGGRSRPPSGASGLVAAPLSPQRSLGPFSSSSTSFSASRPLVATRFHAVVVDGARALAFNLVSGALVQALVPGGGGAGGGRGGDVFSAAAAATAAANAAATPDYDDGDLAPPAHLLPPRPLAADAASGAIYLVSAEGCLLEAAPSGDEGRDAWRAHLARGDFRAAAAAAADDAAARDAVSRAEASHAFFQEGDLARAARLYGRTLSKGAPTFEEVALRFMDSGDRGALMLLLDSRLEALHLQRRRRGGEGGGGSASSSAPPPPADTAAQSAALAAWLAELHLDACNREELVSEAAGAGAARGGGGGRGGAGGAGGSEGEREELEGTAAAPAPARTALRAFLESHADSLDAGVAVGLLAGYGRVDDLLFYAKLRGDTEAVVEHVLSAAASAARRGDAAAASAAARAAVGALRAPGVPRELAYKFAPALFDLCPSEAVDAWLRADPPLAPAKLLPALSHAVDGGGGGGGDGAGKGGKGSASASPASSSSSSTAEARAAALRYVLTVLDGGGGGGEDDAEDGDDEGDADGTHGSSSGGSSRSGLSALHNLAVALLADPRAGGEDAEDALLDFLSRAGKRGRGGRRSGAAPSYDPCLALAAARRGRRRRAAVALLQELGEIEAAVEEALEFDPALAAALAAAAPLPADAAAAASGSSSSSSSAAAGARRRAALSVARALISGADARDPSAAVDAVDGFLRACAEAAAGGGGGSGKAAAAFGASAASASAATSAAALLSLEDVLPLFPDTTCLGALKPAVLRSLDEADARARAARSRARDAAEAADAARRDLRALRGRRGTVSAAAPCARCGGAIGGPPPLSGLLSPSSGTSRISRVYLYPTGNAYHGSCAVEALAESLPAREAAALRRRAGDAAAGKEVSSSAAAASSSGGSGHRSVDEELRAEDPCCGERAVASVGVPLVDPVEDAEALALWRVS